MPATHTTLLGGGSSIPGRYFFFVRHGERDTTTPRSLISHNVARHRHVPDRGKLAATRDHVEFHPLASASLSLRPAPDAQSSSFR